MILDVLVAAIVILAMVQGWRNGFVSTFLHMAGWILSIVLAFVWSPKVKDFLIEKTDFYSSIYKSIFEKYSFSIPDAKESFSYLPSIISNSIEGIKSNIVESMATGVTDFLFTVISFLLVVFAVRILFWLLTSFFSKKKNNGLTGFADGIMGLIFGLLKGLLLVYILLAILIPVVTLASPDYVEIVMKHLEGSYFAGELYNNNPVLLLVRDFMS